MQSAPASQVGRAALQRGDQTLLGRDHVLEVDVGAGVDDERDAGRVARRRARRRRPRRARRRATARPSPSESSRLQPTAPGLQRALDRHAHVAVPALQVRGDGQLDRPRDDPDRLDHRLPRQRLTVGQPARGGDRPARGRDRPAPGRRRHDPRTRRIPRIDQDQRLRRRVQPAQLLGLLTLRTHPANIKGTVPALTARALGSVRRAGGRGLRWGSRASERTSIVKLLGGPLEERVGGHAARVGEPDLAAGVDQAREQREQGDAVARLVQDVGGEDEIPRRARDDRLRLRPRAARAPRASRPLRSALRGGHRDRVRRPVGGEHAPARDRGRQRSAARGRNPAPASARRAAPGRRPPAPAPARSATARPSRAGTPRARTPPR